MEQSNQIFTKLAKAQAKMPQPVFDSENPHFHNKYASLSAIMGAVLPALNEQGLFLTQGVISGTEDTRFLTVVTAVYDDVTRAELSFYPVNIQGCNAQQIGSAITYAKRYSLASVFCRVADEDDDGEAVREVRPTPSRPKQTNPKQKKQPEVIVVNPEDEARKAASIRLWQAIQNWSEQQGKDPKAVVDDVFAERKSEEWSIEELEARAADFESEVV